MQAIWELVKSGGAVMVPIIALSVLLYERCINLMIVLHEVRRRLALEIKPVEANMGLVRKIQRDLPEVYFQQRRIIGSMIAAAPLLGLLGTVTGMISTFESIASRAGERSMQGLASGISQALITTETGLAVVIPAVIVLYYAHRQLQNAHRSLGELESAITEARDAC